MTQSLFQDVGDFHAKFGFPSERDPLPPAPLGCDLLAYRLKFMLEELREFALSQGAHHVANVLENLMAAITPETVGDGGHVHGLADGADALVDLAYVVLGTAHMMRLQFDACWAEVQRANMLKAPGPTKRGHAMDVTKPEGWRGPEHWPLIFKRSVRAEFEMEPGSAAWATGQATLKCFCIDGDVSHVRGADGCLHGANPPQCNCDASCGEDRSHVYGSAGCRYAK